MSMFEGWCLKHAWWFMGLEVHGSQRRKTNSFYSWWPSSFEPRTIKPIRLATSYATSLFGCMVLGSEAASQPIRSLGMASRPRPKTVILDMRKIGNSRKLNITWEVGSLNMYYEFLIKKLLHFGQDTPSFIEILTSDIFPISENIGIGFWV